jgi:hypothetical protein
MLTDFAVKLMEADKEAKEDTSERVGKELEQE